MATIPLPQHAFVLNGQSPPGIGLYSNIFKAKTISIGHTTNGYKCNVNFDYFTVPIGIIEHNLKVCGMFFYGSQTGSMMNNHTIMFQVFGNKVTQIIVFYR